MLSRQIRMRKLDEHLINLSIITNPHKKPEDATEFVEGLLDQRRFMRGDEPVSEELDVEAFEALRAGLSKDSKLIKVK